MPAGMDHGANHRPGNLNWCKRNHLVKFQLGDKILLRFSLPLLSCEAGLEIGGLETVIQCLPVMTNDCQGYLIRSVPVESPQPTFERADGYLRYVPRPYPRYYIDLAGSFADYQNKFSSKTRSTLNRKLKKYAEHCGGTLPWKVYRSGDELVDFHRLARKVSARSYQERRLDSGLPDRKEFVAHLARLADADSVRGYILFDGEQPVAYLCCPISNGIVLYEHLGYDPDYRGWSVGTVLQWLALESIFDEKKFRMFDFTQGESEQKRLFSTGSVLSADVYILRDSIRNGILMRAHHLMNGLSARLGRLLDRLGLKARLKRALRFAD